MFSSIIGILSGALKLFNAILDKIPSWEFKKGQELGKVKVEKQALEVNAKLDKIYDKIDRSSVNFII